MSDSPKKSTTFASHRFSMASRVLLMEPPGSPATMMVWMEKSRRGSSPFSLIFSPSVQA